MFNHNLQKGQGSLTFVIFVAVLLLIGGFVLYTQTQTPQTTTPENKKGQGASKFTGTGRGSLEYQNLLNDLSGNPDSLTGNLNDVSGGNSAGAAYVLRNDGKLQHALIANLQDPPPGTAYEGWLIKKTPSLVFVSTGLLEKQDGGAYTLSFLSDKLFEDYNEVAVTIEAKAGEIPEERILEGIVN